MSLKLTLNYSPNFNISKRSYKEIKFLIFHYTGMKNESAAIKKLVDIRSETSCHYYIKNDGQIISMVPDLYSAWHAGVSFWKGIKSLNKYSLGIEITNPGHYFKYKKFSQKQINSIIRLSKFLIKKYKIKSRNILGHSDIAPTRKKDPGEKFPWKYFSQNKIGIWHNLNEKILIKLRGLKTNNLEKKTFNKNLSRIGYQSKLKKNSKIDKNKNSKLITKAFQRRFRPEVINGIVDQECLVISQKLAKKFN